MEKIEKRAGTLKTLFYIIGFLEICLNNYDDCISSEKEIYCHLQNCINQIDKTIKLAAKEISNMNFDEFYKKLYHEEK